MSLASFTPRAPGSSTPHSPPGSPRRALGALYPPAPTEYKDDPVPEPTSPVSPPIIPRSRGGPVPRSGAEGRSSQRPFQHLFVLPVLLLEFLALGLTRAVLPGLLLEEYGSGVYLVLGAADCVRGLLAFGACPLFGKLSDSWGRARCLGITVLGTCAPVCSLALASLWWGGPGLPPLAIPVFVVLLALSGIFSSTFTLVFAYISDTVDSREDRVSAYGLALATFGLSFTIGPMAGGYLAEDHPSLVFRASLLLTVLDLIYIAVWLPESNPPPVIDYPPKSSSSSSISSLRMLRKKIALPSGLSWNPLESVRFLAGDPFLRRVGQVALFYYTGLWAVISTLGLYAVRRFDLTPQKLGELMSALGLCTMVAEAVLVRLLVPLWGEKTAVRVGLASFALQCVVLGAATEAWHLLVCVGFSLLGNLVYPSLSSMVSSLVEPSRVGEALGALNGVKALTEGLGPLLFGALMTASEDSALPGWPYWIAAGLVWIAFDLAAKLPDDHHHDADLRDDYVHELAFKKRRKGKTGGGDEDDDVLMGTGCLDGFPTPTRDDDEYEDLLQPLSEVEESDPETITAAPRGGDPGVP